MFDYAKISLGPHHDPAVQGPRQPRVLFLTALSGLIAPERYAIQSSLRINFKKGP